VTVPIGAVPVLPERYADVGFLAKGGSSTVYRARDVEDSTLVAVKVLDGTERRWHRELRALHRLRDVEGIVSVRDSGTLADGRRYLVTDYFAAGTLASQLADGRRYTADEVVCIGVRLADVLAVAQGVGVVHCDVKPSNVLVDNAGLPHLADFGIARAAVAPGETTDHSETFSFTLLYTAPEVLEGDRPSERSDQYSLGLTLATLVLGRHPYAEPARPGLAGLVDGIRNAVFPFADLLAAGAPVALVEALATACSPKPADRFASTAAFADALRSVAPSSSPPQPLGHRRPRRRRAAKVAAGVLGVGVIAAISAFTFTRLDGAPATTAPPVAPPAPSLQRTGIASDTQSVALPPAFVDAGGAIEMAMFVPAPDHRMCLSAPVAAALPFGQDWCDTRWIGDARGFSGEDRVDPLRSQLFVRVDLDQQTVSASARDTCSTTPFSGPEVCVGEPAPVVETDAPYSTRFRTDWKSCGEQPLIMALELDAECRALTGQWYLPGEESVPYVNAYVTSVAGDEVLRIEFNYSERDASRNVPRMTHEARIDLFADHTFTVERDCWPSFEMQRLTVDGVTTLLEGEPRDVVNSSGGPTMPIELNGAKDKECADLGVW
jgi:hypothetical protein